MYLECTVRVTNRSLATKAIVFSVWSRCDTKEQGGEPASGNETVFDYAKVVLTVAQSSPSARVHLPTFHTAPVAKQIISHTVK